MPDDSCRNDSSQLMALVEAMEMGYHSMPKKDTVDETASRVRMPRLTFEEH